MSDSYDDPDQADHAGAIQPALGPKQAQAVMALLQEPTIARAASAAGVSERTLRRWMREAPFHHAYLDARRDAFSHAVGLIQRYAPVAVSTLVKVMMDGGTSGSAKVTAAAVLLRMGREGIELDDIAARIEALEQMASANGSQNN